MKIKIFNKKSSLVFCNKIKSTITQVTNQQLFMLEGERDKNITKVLYYRKIKKILKLKIKKVNVK